MRGVDQVVKGVVHAFCVSFRPAERWMHPMIALLLLFSFFFTSLVQSFFVCFLEGGFAFPFVRPPSGFTLSREDGTDFTYRPRPIRNLDIEPVAYFYASLLIHCC